MGSEREIIVGAKMKRSCIFCGEPAKNPWDNGNKICDECLKDRESDWKSNKNRMNIELPFESKLGQGATYQHGTGIIRVYDFSILSAETCLSHEIVHHVLNHFISVQASICYDNVSGGGELERWINL